MLTMKQSNLIYLVLMLCLSWFTPNANCEIVYLINFDHGVQSPDPNIYTAGTGEVLPTDVNGVCQATDFNNPFITSTGLQGGEAWKMTRGAAWPNEQGYRFDGGPGIGAANVKGGWTMEFLIEPNYTDTGFGLSQTSALYKGAPNFGTAGASDVRIDQTTHKIAWDNNFSYSWPCYDMYSTTSLNSGQWYHIAIVARATGLQATQRMELWVNGTLESIAPFPIGWEAIYGIPTDFSVGSWYNYTTRNFQGAIDAFCIDDEALEPGSFNLSMPARPTYWFTFNHGKWTPGPEIYTASVTKSQPATSQQTQQPPTNLPLSILGEVIPYDANVTRQSEDTNLDYVLVNASEGAEALTQTSGAGRPNEQGYEVSGGPELIAPWTIEFLVNPNYTNTGYGLSNTSTIYDGSPVWGEEKAHKIYLDQTTGKISWDSQFTGNQKLTSTTVLEAGQWYHVAVVARATGESGTQQMELWVNGVVEDSESFSVGLEKTYGIPEKFNIGSSCDSNGLNFQGQIDSFIITNTAFDAAGFKLSIPDCSTLYPGDVDSDCNVGLSDLEIISDEWLTGSTPGSAGYTIPAYLNPPETRLIPQGTAVVDGNLTEWAGASWILLDKVIEKTPYVDISEAKYSLRWDADSSRIYIAVIVNDSVNMFTDDATVNYYQSDRVFVHSQARPGSGLGWDMESLGDITLSQNYMVGSKINGIDAWADGFYGEEAGDVNSHTEFEYAVTVNATAHQIIYELGVKQFDYYDSNDSNNIVVSDLHPGDIVGLDVHVLTKYGSKVSNGGMLGENLNLPGTNYLYTASSLIADTFGKYRLAGTDCGSWDFLDGDISGTGGPRDCRVNFYDFADMALDWMESSE